MIWHLYNAMRGAKPCFDDANLLRHDDMARGCGAMAQHRADIMPGGWHGGDVLADAVPASCIGMLMWQHAEMTAR